ncbi:MAG TPA: Mg2+ transporter protein, CorA-like protein [Bacillus bacterium]|uniref:Magnesium transport protein CorA n=1 Tax=Siminovitchia fordii TaxID=254759 RepID=A0ABQ4K014_9BACI|nr:magnesium transporter CorA family protein [Siminovitchia fordii]GIN19105.1 magnesium transport protein CorA [Siminovitchia fordii]HBZ10280.1 Mg2+ transporter protein, CorA-like protein [Bacillus sp. (in: firmicutes)]
MVIEEKKTAHYFQHGWTWIDLDFEDEDEIERLQDKSAEFGLWVKNAKNIQSTSLKILPVEKGGSTALVGSLNYLCNPENADSYELLHFYISKDTLITFDLDIDSIFDYGKEVLLEQFQKCDNAIEGFLLTIGEVLKNFLDGIDDFEEKLLRLEKVIRERSHGNMLEEIFECRSEMLFLKQLTIPVEEMLLAMQEAYLDKVEEMDAYRKVVIRVERTMKLLYHYDNQIETLLNINMNVYTYRGNEIIKALTVFTVLVTPITVLGALWGMNFKFMPEFDWKYGYGFAWGVILLSTGLIYWWLHEKGWTGDVMKGRKK